MAGYRFHRFHRFHRIHAFHDNHTSNVKFHAEQFMRARHVKPSFSHLFQTSVGEMLMQMLLLPKFLLPREFTEFTPPSVHIPAGNGQVPEFHAGPGLQG